MDLRRALKVLNIEELIESKKKQASKHVIAGRFECCGEINEAIKVVKEFLGEGK